MHDFFMSTTMFFFMDNWCSRNPNFVYRCLELFLLSFESTEFFLLKSYYFKLCADVEYVENNAWDSLISLGTKKIRKPKPWKLPHPITKSQLIQMREEFWDTAPHYGGRKGSCNCELLTILLKLRTVI